MTPDDVDPQLVELSRSVDDFVDLTMREDSDYSIFCIGAKMSKSPSSSEDGLKTCLAAGGKLEIIEESLYAEVANQITSGDARLFFMLSNVVDALEEQLGEQIAALEESADSTDSAKVAIGDHVVETKDSGLFGDFDLDLLRGMIMVSPESNKKH